MQEIRSLNVCVILKARDRNALNNCNPARARAEESMGFQVPSGMLAWRMGILEDGNS